MKIAVFHNLPPGGAKRTIYRQIKSLSKKHELHLFKLTSTDETCFNLKPFCQKVFQFNFKLSNHLLNPTDRLVKDFHNFFTLAKVHQQIARMIDKNNYQVCLIHPDQLTQAPFILKYLNTPSLYYCHEWLRIAYEKELSFQEPVFFVKSLYERLTRVIRKTIDRQNAQAADLILTNSLFTQKHVLKAYGKKAVVCYPGVDTQVFKPLPLKQEKKLVFVGASAKIIGFELAQKALSLIPRDIRPKLEVVSGFKLNDQQMVKVYNQSLAALCLSYHEPFGSVALESMACAVPVIAVNEGGYKETVINNQTGFLIPRHPQILADKITYLINHPQTARQMGQLGRQHVSRHFTWKSHLAILEQSLKKIAYAA